MDNVVKFGVIEEEREILLSQLLGYSPLVKKVESVTLGGELVVNPLKIVVSSPISPPPLLEPSMINISFMTSDALKRSLNSFS